MTVALIAAAPELHALLERRGLQVTPFASFSELTADSVDVKELTTIVVGESVHDPMQAVARGYRIDPALGVVILAADDVQLERLRTALRFAPVVGKDVSVVNQSAADAIELIFQAVTRSRARRKHRRVIHAMATASPPVTSAPSSSSPNREHFTVQLLALAPVGIVTVDAHSSIASANAVAARVLGRSERDLIGLRLGGEELGADEGGWEKLLEAATLEPESPVRIVRGGVLLDARAVVIPGQSRTTLVVFDDVTAQALAYERAEEANRLKDDFIALISHELRTPLNAIVGWTQLLKQATLTPERIQQGVDVIERNANAQTQLVDSLLDMSTVVAGRVTLKLLSSDLRRVVERSITAALPAAITKGVDIMGDLDATPPLPMDGERMYKVVGNLISNAVKFTPRGGRVDVSLREVDGATELRVQDNGIGIGAEMLTAIFDPFRQAEAGSRRAHGGLGLGLAVARRLVELHGGTLTAESKGPGKGALFLVRMPNQASEAPDAKLSVVPSPAADTRGSNATQPLAGIPCLIVEDDDDARELLAEVLGLAGAKTTTASSVAEARDQLGRARPDVIISDLGMPHEDGYDLIRFVRTEYGAGIPVVALTAWTRERDRARTAESGFNGHLSKPVNPSELVAMVAGLARRGSSSPQ